MVQLNGSFNALNIRLFQKFLSLYKEIMDAQQFLFYIILSNYVWPFLFRNTLRISL